MQKSYIAKTTINFVDFEFYVRSGDLLVHDTANQNRLTVYRNGQIVKVVKQDPIGIVAFLKNKYIEEVVPVVTPAVAVVPVAPPPVVEAPKARSIQSDAPTPVPERSKPYSKRDKAHAQEVPIDEYLKRVGELPETSKSDELVEEAKTEK